jgi:valyl-tRNA synthetase
LAEVCTEVGEALEQYDFHDAAMALYRFTWDDFCDWYVEAAKRRIWAAENCAPDSPEAADAARVRHTLGSTLATLLRLLHPITPFLSEALWTAMPAQFKNAEDLLMTAEWPQQAGLADADAIEEFTAVQDLVRGFRNVKALLEIAPSEKPHGSLAAANDQWQQKLSQQTTVLCGLSGLDSIEVHDADHKPQNCGTDSTKVASVFLPFTADTDPSKLKQSLQKKLQKVQGGIGGIEKKLGNERFLKNADSEIVEAEKMRLTDLQQQAKTLQENLEALA